jgi:hypothetical protein
VGVTVSTDIRGIQAYIFEAAPLVQMRGASRLVAQFGKTVRTLTEQYYGRVLSGGGGNGFYRFAEAANAHEFAEAVRSSWTTATGLDRSTITISTTADDESESSVSQDRMVFDSRLIQAARNDLADAKETHLVLRPTWPAALAMVCTVCHRRAAVHVDVVGDVCDVCLRRYTAGMGAEADLWEELELGSTKRVNNLETFATSSRKSGYIAVVVADGNSIGQLLATCADTKTLTAQLDSAASGGVRRAADEIRRMDPDALHPVLLPQWIGGDDAIFTVRPQHVFVAVPAFVRSFARSVPGASMSAAVVVAHASFPFDQLLEIGTELLDEVKKGVRAGWGSGRSDLGGLAIKVVSSSHAQRKDAPDQDASEGSGAQFERDAAEVPPIPIDHTDQSDWANVDLAALLNSRLLSPGSGDFTWDELLTAAEMLVNDGLPRGVTRDLSDARPTPLFENPQLNQLFNRLANVGRLSSVRVLTEQIRRAT